MPAGRPLEVVIKAAVLAEIARVLVDNDVRLYRLQPMQASLESWFLQVTSRLGAEE